ncbi:MAG: UDP-N-acetylglucosamine 2-epimerase [Polyangiales bacterium]
MSEGTTAPRPRKKIVFLTGTRADFGKLKPLIQVLRSDGTRFEVHIFATGMHLEPLYGSTVREIEKSGFDNIYRFINQTGQGPMDRSLAYTIAGFGDYIRVTRPQLIVVHGDRIEALAGAMVGGLQNVRVAHVEGGELSGTIDGVIRHAVSKLSHIHFVSNEAARTRLLQLGELPESIHVIGSPDVDIMRSRSLPSLAAALAHYEIPFTDYALLVFHPVTTRLETLRRDTRALLGAVAESGHNYIVIYPNSDAGSAMILEAYATALFDKPWVRAFPSIRFEHLLVLLKHARFILGNSSMGIQEAPYFGVPTINVGSRQAGRTNNPHILHVEPVHAALRAAIDKACALQGKLKPLQEFGDGQSHVRFHQTLRGEAVWSCALQKPFRELAAVHSRPPPGTGTDHALGDTPSAGPHADHAPGNKPAGGAGSPIA